MAFVIGEEEWIEYVILFEEEVFSDDVSPAVAMQAVSQPGKAVVKSFGCVSDRYTEIERLYFDMSYDASAVPLEFYVVTLKPYGILGLGGVGYEVFGKVANDAFLPQEKAIEASLFLGGIGLGLQGKLR